MLKQERKSTARGKIGTFADGSALPFPSFRLTTEERRLFKKIVLSREASTWVDTDLHTASLAAQLGSQLSRLFQEAVEEGFLTLDARGEMVENKKLFVYHRLVNQYNRLMSNLGLTATARGLGGPRIGKRSATENKDKKRLASVSKLIPTS